MLVFIRCFPAREEVKVIVRRQGAPGQQGKRMTISLAPGIIWRGYSYEELMRLGAGSHRLQIPRPNGQAEQGQAQ